VVFHKDWIRIEEVLHEDKRIGQNWGVDSLPPALFGDAAYDRISRRSRICSLSRLCEQEHAFPSAFIQEISTLRRFAEYYRLPPLSEEETNIPIQQALTRLNKLEAVPTYPLLLAAYDARERERLRLLNLLSW